MAQCQFAAAEEMAFFTDIWYSLSIRIDISQECRNEHTDFRNGQMF